MFLSSASAATDTAGRRNRARWLIPLAVTGVVLGGPAAAALVPAAATDSLPPLTAAELLAKIRTAEVAGFSGTVTASTDIGLPKLPIGTTGGAGAGAGAIGLLSGDHSLRVWSGGPEQSRIALLDTFAETEVVRSGTDLWAYDSAKNAATHVRLPDRAALAKQRAATAPAEADGNDSGTGLESLTPADAAAKVLAAIDPNTEVGVGAAATVAGRPAYELQLRPRSTNSLVGTVVLAVDSASGLPLRVAVTPHGQADPAVDVRFTQISLDKPDAARFRFSPPKGASVQERSVEAGMVRDPRPDGAAESTRARPEIVGTGWDSVTISRGLDLTAMSGTASPAAGDPAGGSSQRDLAGALTQTAKPVTGAFGEGKLVRTSLLTALLTSDGRVYSGAVTPDALLAVASAHR